MNKILANMRRVAIGSMAIAMVTLASCNRTEQKISETRQEMEKLNTEYITSINDSLNRNARYMDIQRRTPTLNKNIDRLKSANAALSHQARDAYIKRIGQKYKLNKYFSESEIAQVNAAMHANMANGHVTDLTGDATLIDLANMGQVLYNPTTDNNAIFAKFRHPFQLGGGVLHPVCFIDARMQRELDTAMRMVGIATADNAAYEIDMRARDAYMRAASPIQAQIDRAQYDSPDMQNLVQKLAQIQARHGYNPETDEFDAVKKFWEQNGVNNHIVYDVPNFAIPEFAAIRDQYMQNYNKMIGYYSDIEAARNLEIDVTNYFQTIYQNSFDSLRVRLDSLGMRQK